MSDITRLTDIQLSFIHVNPLSDVPFSDPLTSSPVPVAFVISPCSPPCRCRVAQGVHTPLAPSELCVRLSPHTALQSNVAIYALGQRPPLLYFLFISHLTSIVCRLWHDFSSIDKMFSEMFQSTQPDYA